MTQSLLSHGGIRTLPGARVQGGSVSTCMVVPAYMMFRGARISMFLPKHPLAASPSRSCLPPALRCLLPGPSWPWAWRPPLKGAAPGCSAWLVLRPTVHLIPSEGDWNLNATGFRSRYPISSFKSLGVRPVLSLGHLVNRCSRDCLAAPHEHKCSSGILNQQ
jgi:hypothetical protein